MQMSCLEHRRELTQQPGKGRDSNLPGAFSTLWGNTRPYQSQEEMICLSPPIHLQRASALRETNATANQGWNESEIQTATDCCCILQLFIPPRLCQRLALTWAPEGDALLLVGLADAVVAVAIHAMARVPIVQVNVGRALRAGPGAELGQVTGIARLSARNPRWLELQTHTASRAVLWLGQP